MIFIMFILFMFISHSKRTKQKVMRNLCVQLIKDNNNNERITYIQHNIL